MMPKEVIFFGKPLKFSPGNHRYYWGGTYVPSVTTILGRLSKPMLIQWAANCAVDHVAKIIAFANEIIEGKPRGISDTALAVAYDEARKAHETIRDDAGAVGTSVHEVARALLASGLRFPDLPPQNLSPQVVMALRALEEWRDTHKVEPLALERRIFSAELMYAGTCDFFGHIDGDLCVLDFKTGSGVYDEAWYQLAGYERALIEELNLTERLTHWIVHLDKNTGECRPYRRKGTETMAASTVWRSLVQLDRAIRDMPKMERARVAA